PVQPLLRPDRAVARNLVTMIEAEQNTVLRLGVDVHLVVRDRPLNIGVAARVEDHLQRLRKEPAGVVRVRGLALRSAEAAEFAVVAQHRYELGLIDHREQRCRVLLPELERQLQLRPESALYRVELGRVVACDVLDWVAVIDENDLVDIDAPLTHVLDPSDFGVQALEDSVDGGVDPSALRLDQLQICEVHHLGYWLSEPGAERAPGEWL